MFGLKEYSISTTRGRQEQAVPELRQSLAFAEGILGVVREPLLVLDSNLRIVWANNSFYKVFSMIPQETEGSLIYEIGNGQWNIQELREMLQGIRPDNADSSDFEVEYDFPQIGRRSMVLNAKLIQYGESKIYKILLTVDFISKRKWIAKEKVPSELKYRRLFETAQDGILILNAETGQIIDVNPFLINMLGYSKNELMGKRLWEIGVFTDAAKSREAYKELQKNNYIRYEDLPLETKNGLEREVEFVSNVYLVNNERVIQCNIRDISQRKQLERNLNFAATHDFLTDLPNRTLLNDHYILALAGAKRYHNKLAIMVLDLDHFKYINDSLGHQCGDQVLQEFAKRLSGIMRQTDTLSRMGGDEFTLLLTEVTETKTIECVAQKILENTRNPFWINNQEVKITSSIGISNYPEDGQDLETLIKCADIAMYQAKMSGRDNYQMYTQGKN